MGDRNFSSFSSFAGNNRRHHGLLIQKGMILLNALHEEMNGIRLSSGWWGDTFLGEGLAYITGTTVYPVRQEFCLPRGRITRTIILNDGLLIRYEIIGSISLSIRPLMNLRPCNLLNKEPVMEVSQENGNIILNGCRVQSSLPFTSDLQRYLNAYYPRDDEQGDECREDLLSPGFFSGTITDTCIEIKFTPEPCHEFVFNACIHGSEDILTHATGLCISGDEILVGHPWLDHSYDQETFLSLPGLLLEHHKFREAEDVFRRYLDRWKCGMIPTRYSDQYDSADGVLWFFWALFQYIQKIPKSLFIPTIKDEIESLLFNFPSNGIVTLEGSLIYVKEGSTRVDTFHIPRVGKPVDINALWILALELAEYLNLQTPVHSSDARLEFLSYWNEEKGCLYDLLDPDDGTIRSNQVIALAFGLIPFDDGRHALDVIRKKLLTPYGIRVLEPESNEDCKGSEGKIIYADDLVCPWQIGFYVDALIRYGEDPDHIRQVIGSLWNYFLTDGVGMVPQFFEGTPPHQPTGAICYACSIAELIRARNQILLLIKPHDRCS
ncbi:MAG TPA: amylo-alpha-1,6-glucosidase [Methanospirillum sp.]|nr:amylo-alpha-1,6-glucosidase [Methanospirillum sp.]